MERDKESLNQPLWWVSDWNTHTHTHTHTHKHNVAVSVLCTARWTLSSPFCFTLMRAPSLHNRTDGAQDKAFWELEKEERESEVRLREEEKEGQRERESYWLCSAKICKNYFYTFYRSLWATRGWFCWEKQIAWRVTVVFDPAVVM